MYNLRIALFYLKCMLLPLILDANALKESFLKSYLLAFILIGSISAQAKLTAPLGENNPSMGNVVGENYHGSKHTFAEANNEQYEDLLSVLAGRPEMTLAQANICTASFQCNPYQFVFCTTYGDACTWFIGNGWVECTGFDRYGRWLELEYFCP